MYVSSRRTPGDPVDVTADALHKLSHGNGITLLERGTNLGEFDQFEPEPTVWRAVVYRYTLGGLLMAYELEGKLHGLVYRNIDPRPAAALLHDVGATPWRRGELSTRFTRSFQVEMTCLNTGVPQLCELRHDASMFAFPQPLD